MLWAVYGRCCGSVFFVCLSVCNNADVSPLLARWDDPNMAEDPGVSQVIRQLDQACREAGFFYVVSSSSSAFSPKFARCIF